MSGLLQAHKSVIKTRDQFIDLAVHEMFRVFGDRLVSTTDQNIFCDIVADQLREFLKVKWSKERLAKSETFFGDFQESSVPEHKRIYQSIHDIGRLQRILEVRLYFHLLESSNLVLPKVKSLLDGWCDIFLTYLVGFSHQSFRLKDQKDLIKQLLNSLSNIY